MGNKLDVMQHVLKMQKTSMLPKHIKLFSKCVFLCMFTYANVSHLKVHNVSTHVTYQGTILLLVVVFSSAKPCKW